ncbi:MAG: apolipoprotein N-acyltransferase [Planctomycetales bacterium]|nr:apolipoprotein N-acyltransferase [Planctomycetales bacterium]
MSSTARRFRSTDDSPRRSAPDEPDRTAGERTEGERASGADASGEQVDAGKRRRRGNESDRQANDEAATEKRGGESPSTRMTLGLAMLAAGLLFAAHYPIGWWPLAFVAPAPWAWLAGRGIRGGPGYAALWLSGFVYWLAMLQGIRLAHPALYLGWFALSAYLAVYTPLFVGLTASAVRRWRTPLVIAAPVVWVGLEVFRSYALTGFAIGLLGHAVVEWTQVIQVADLGGAYTVSFLLAFVAACVARCFLGARVTRAGECRSEHAAGKGDSFGPGNAKWLGLGAVAIAITLGYGGWRMQAADDPGTVEDASPLKVALIQGSMDVVFEHNPERNERTFRDYYEQTLRVRAEHPDLDLVVWPESMFTANEPEYLAAEGMQVPPGQNASMAQFREMLDEHVRAFGLKAKYTAAAVNRLETDEGQRRLDIACLVGLATVEFGESVRQYNTALLIGSDGEVADRYYKMHPVMFGEYIPFGDLAPWLYSITPMSGGLTPGPGPQAFSVGPWRLAPSICFESTVPHLIRRHWTELAARGERPDALVCLTNDGWFWGSSVLDLHLHCSVMRAVELRTPMLVAANTGFSAVVDGDGRILQRGPRRAAAELVAEVRPDRRESLYRAIGDWPAGLCLLFCGAVAARAWLGRRSERRSNSTGQEG